MTNVDPSSGSTPRLLRLARVRLPDGVSVTRHGRWHCFEGKVGSVGEKARLFLSVSDSDGCCWIVDRVTVGEDLGGN